jgi:hypothetical protein
METARPETGLEMYARVMREELAAVLEPKDLPWPMAALYIACGIYCFASAIYYGLFSATPPPIF